MTPRVAFNCLDHEIIEHHARAREATGRTPELAGKRISRPGIDQIDMDRRGVAAEWAVCLLARREGFHPKWLGSGIGRPVPWDLELGGCRVDVKSIRPKKRDLILSGQEFPDDMDALVLVRVDWPDLAFADVLGAATARVWNDNRQHRKFSYGWRWAVNVDDLGSWAQLARWVKQGMECHAT